MTPEKLGRYEILGELGKGAMGVVYLAQDPIIRRHLAIKTFRMAYSAKEKEIAQFRERFLREAQAIGQLNHRNIVTVHDVGHDGEDYFIAMEYVKGINLKQRMQREDGPLPLGFVIDVVAQIADGLDCAHQKGIVHRDVKPANIIITHDQQVKITDFGIARIEQSNLTVAGQLLGTPNYMAPEQIQGKAVDARSDIFALGVLLYELLTRKKPFQGENLTQVSHRIVYDEFTPPEEHDVDVPTPLVAILRRALEKDPGARYQEVSEMARALRALAVAAGVGPSAEIPSAEDSGTPAALWPPPPAPPSAVPPPVPAAPVAPAAVPPPPPAPPVEESPPITSTRPAFAAPRVAGAPAFGRPRTPFLVATAAVVVLGIAALLLLRPGNVASSQQEAGGPAAIDAFLQSEAAVIARAEQLAAAGVPDQALMVVLAGYGELPYSVDLTRTYFRLAPAADRKDDVLAAYVQERMLVAEAYITARKYESAYDVLALVLFADPTQAVARSRAQDIERFLDRRRQAQIQADRHTQPSPQRAAAPEPPAVTAPPEPPAQGALEIAFRTLVAEGKLTVYAHDGVVFERDFDFPNRKFLKKKFLKSERGFDETLALASGTVDIHATVEVELKDESRVLRSPRLTGNIPPASARVLRITVGEDATLDVRFE